MAECPTFDTILSQLATATLLGRGAQGTVHKVNEFVLKKVNLRDEKAKRLFDGEANALMTLSTNQLTRQFLPELCWIYRTAETGYILQKYEPVISLKELIATTAPKSFPFETGFAIYKNLRFGIARIGKVGFLHRDIKPENILIRTSSPEAMKIPIFIDFGLAIPLSEWKTAIKAGTPEFMSPNMLPRQIHQKQPTMRIGNRNVYVQTQLVNIETTPTTEFYALALTLEQFYPIIDFTGHGKEDAEMQSFIVEMKQKVFLNTFKKRRNNMAKRQGWGPLSKHTYESIGTAEGGTRTQKQKSKRRATRKY